MKSGTRNLVIVAAAIVVLGGAAAALTLTGGGKGGASSSASSSINLIEKKSEDVVSMSVKNKKGSYQITAQVVPANSAAANFTASGSVSSEASASSGSTETTYAVEGLESAEVDSSLVQQVFQNGYSLVGSQDLGETNKLEEFGLKDPQATVEVAYKDGSTLTYQLGNVSAADSTSYYMCKQGSSRVYVVSVDAGLFEGKNYFVKKAVLAVGSAGSGSTDGSTNDFTAITLTGKNYPKPIVLSKENNALVMTSPYKASLDSANLSALENALTTVTAASVEAVNPDAAALKKYGLDNPAAAVSFLVNKGAYKLLAGNKTGGNYYVMLDKGKVVYQVEASGVEAWVNATAFALRTKSLVVPAISTVKAVTFAKGGASSGVTVARAKDDKQSTEDNTVYTYTVTAGGAKLDYEKVYQPVYLKLISPEILEESTAKPADAPVYTLEYQYFDKSGKDTVQFYAAGDRRYLAVVNGETAGLVTSAEIDSLYADWQQALSGKTVS